jgi:hypothetical protein
MISSHVNLARCCSERANAARRSFERFATSNPVERLCRQNLGVSLFVSLGVLILAIVLSLGLGGLPLRPLPSFGIVWLAHLRLILEEVLE